MSRYDKGADFEREVREFLTKQSYLANRCAGSKGKKKVDVIAIPPSPPYALPPWTNLGGLANSVLDPYKPLLIQCKLAGTASQFEREQLTQAAEKFGCIPIIASKTEDKKIKFEVLK